MVKFYKRLIIIFLKILIIGFYVVPVLAHSGGVDNNGGHKCRTNCEDYGLYYGEYHYHDENDFNVVDWKNSNNVYLNREQIDELSTLEKALKGFDIIFFSTLTILFLLGLIFKINEKWQEK